MKKVSFVFGTRPEAIKLAPLIKLFNQDSSIQTEVCLTGQHREMLQQVLSVFDIKADINLDLMLPDQTLTQFVSRSLVALDNYIRESQPDCIFVQGDTSTVLTAAQAAFYHKKKVFHVEAGLRTGDLYSPFPEEMNRRLTTRLAHHHFAPTETARENLLREGVAQDTITVTGNTAIDSLLTVVGMINSGELMPDLPAALTGSIREYKNMVLITGHRRENFGNGFVNICEAIRELSVQHKDCLFVYPVHLNPNVSNVVHDMLKDIPNIKLIPPQSYVEFIYLMTQAQIILTDSGGVQEEGPSLGKPILVMRENTERPEGVEAGCSKLVGVDKNTIITEVSRLLKDQEYYSSFSVNANPYGDGHAAKYIMEKVLKMINEPVIYG